MSSTWPAALWIWERCWVVCCDLFEKIKLRFDTKVIQFTFSQLDLHINDESSRAHGSDFLENEGMAGLAPRGTEDEGNI